MVGVVLEGIVTSGLGEGALFISMDHYKKEIKNKLGFEPYPGTFNIKTNNLNKNIFNKFKVIRIEGYKKDNKTFGGASCYKAKINNINGSIIMPDINKHEEDIIEFIAPINIKEELKIKNGDKVKIELK